MKRKIKINKKVMAVLVPVLAAAIVFSGIATAAHLDKINTGKITKSGEEIPPAESANASISLIAVGDNLIQSAIIDSCKQGEGYDFSPIYSNVEKYIKQSDIAVINQETLLGGSDYEISGQAPFNSPTEVGDAAINAGFNVFTTATDHVMDMGIQGVNSQIDYFNRHGEVVFTGTNKDENESNSIKYIEKNGIKIAVLNYTFGTNGISVPEDKKYLVNMLDDKKKLQADVKKAQKQTDFVIVFAHWGTEYSKEISSYQESYVKLFSELGVDAVIGTNPQVLEPVKWVENEKTGKKMLVYYSLGCFVSHRLDKDALVGAMAEIKIKRTNGKTNITSAKATPLITHFSASDGVTSFSVYKFSDYTDSLAQSHVVEGIDKDYVKNLFEGVIDSEFVDY